MGKGMNKERAVFIAGAILFVWVMVKLGLYWTRPSDMPTVPKAAASVIRRGNEDIGNFTATDGLASYLGRGSRDPFFAHSDQPTSFFVRTTIGHSILASNVFSRYTFDCRMAPQAVSEVRFRLPAQVRVTDVFSKELNKERPWGVDGRILVVPVIPARVRRSFFRCQVTLILRAPVTPPAKWTAPVIACSEATPNVLSETGYIAVATPGDHVLVAAVADSRAEGLWKAKPELLPKALAARSNKLAYSFKEPNYQLVLGIQPKQVAVATPPKPAKPVKPAKPPVVRTNPPVVRTDPPAVAPTPEPPPKEDTLVIPKAGDADSLPFKLTGIVRTRDPEPKGQAVISFKESGELFRMLEGEEVDIYKVTSITNDAVTVRDKAGKFYVLRLSRFVDKNN